MGDFEEKLLTVMLRTCGGTVFWFCAGNDREHIAPFRRTMQAVERNGKGGWDTIWLGWYSEGVAFRDCEGERDLDAV